MNAEKQRAPLNRIIVLTKQFAVNSSAQICLRWRKRKKGDTQQYV